MQVETLELQSEKNRKRLVEIVYKAKAGHIGGDLSCLNVLTALYFDIMRVWPDKPKETKRDRFVMSKGTLCGGFICYAGGKRLSSLMR